MKKYKVKENNIQKLKLYLKKVEKDGKHDRMGTGRGRELGIRRRGAVATEWGQDAPTGGHVHLSSNSGRCMSSHRAP